MRAKSNRSLAIQYLLLDELQLDPRNPRGHSKSQIRQIARSIETFGFIVPILLDRAGNVLAGHGRVHAARLCGLKRVPVIRIEHLTEAQARAFNIADNRLAEHSTWDDRLLGEIFNELDAQNLDFTLDVTGFTVGEIDLKIEGASDHGESEPDPADHLPEMRDQPAVSEPGDLWCLGRHRILCASALESVSYQALMEGSRADLSFTDPPYNVPIDGNVSGKGRIHHREFLMASGEMTPGQFIYFLTRALDLIAQNSRNGSIHYICMDWRHQRELLTAAEQAYSGGLQNLCVWVKDNAGMGSFYRSQHELIFVFKNGKGRHHNNIELGRFGRNRTNVWRYPSPGNFGRKGEEGNLLELHPTVKPVAMVADAIMDCSARGDIVLDPFLGSGSTLIAAERVGRCCYALEIDPAYVDTAIRRWQLYTGERATHAGSGRTFDEIAAAAEARHGR